MLTLTDEYKESFCQLLLNFLKQHTKPLPLLDNKMMELGGIIAKSESALKLHDDVLAFVKMLPVYWYHYLPGFDHSVLSLRFHLTKILKDERFSLENLSNAVIVDLKNAKQQLQDEIIRLQIENQKLQHILSNETSPAQNNSSMALITSEHAETIKVLENKIQHLQEYLTQTLEENKKLKLQLNELIQKEKDLIAHNHHLISGNFLGTQAPRRIKDEQQQLACSLPRGFGENKMKK